MAYRSKNLSIISYNNGYTMYHYCSREDNLNKILGDSKYFDNMDLYNLCNTGDIIFINAIDSVAMRYMVKDNENKKIYFRKVH